MNKKSHMIFTDTMNVAMPAFCSKLLKIGSILPDIFAHTYLVGHTWDASGSKILRKLEKLETSGILNGWFCLKLGMILHYIEDYFTVAHSRYFKGNLIEHILYERKLQRYIENCYNNTKQDFPDINIQSVEALSDYVICLQNAYQKNIAEVTDQENLCFEVDLHYMSMAVGAVIRYVVPLMEERMVIYRKLVCEAMIKMPQENVVFMVSD